MRVHLLPLGRGRFELYAEPVENATDAPAHDAGRLRHWLHAAGEQWRDLVDTARRDGATSRLGRWRDEIIGKLADSLDEQRAMRSLRTAPDVDAWFPASMTRDAARAAVDRRLVEARRFHGLRFGVYLALFITSGILFFVPGPNIVAYYLGFQAFGHMQSWLGARRGSRELPWVMVASDDLAHLAGLIERGGTDLEAGFAEVAERLGLPRLPAFLARAVA